MKYGEKKGIALEVTFHYMYFTSYQLLLSHKSSKIRVSASLNCRNFFLSYFLFRLGVPLGTSFLILAGDTNKKSENT